MNYQKIDAVLSTQLLKNRQTYHIFLRTNRSIDIVILDWLKGKNLNVSDRILGKEIVTLNVSKAIIEELSAQEWVGILEGSGSLRLT